MLTVVMHALILLSLALGKSLLLIMNVSVLILLPLSAKFTTAHLDKPLYICFTDMILHMILLMKNLNNYACIASYMIQ